MLSCIVLSLITNERPFGSYDYWGFLGFSINYSVNKVTLYKTTSFFLQHVQHPRTKKMVRVSLKLDFVSDFQVQK